MSPAADPITYNRKWREGHIEQRRATSRAWWANNLDKAHEASRKYRLKRKYHLSPEAYADLYAKQNGCCAICGKEELILSVDHNHNTGQVRGLLCKPCNRGLGVFGDSAEGLRVALAYLEEGS